MTDLNFDQRLFTQLLVQHQITTWTIYVHHLVEFGVNLVPEIKQPCHDHAHQITASQTLYVQPRITFPTVNCDFNRTISPNLLGHCVPFPSAWFTAKV